MILKCVEVLFLHGLQYSLDINESELVDCFLPKLFDSLLSLRRVQEIGEPAKVIGMLANDCQ